MLPCARAVFPSTELWLSRVAVGLGAVCAAAGSRAAASMAGLRPVWAELGLRSGWPGLVGGVRCSVTMNVAQVLAAPGQQELRGPVRPGCDGHAMGACVAG